MKRASLASSAADRRVMFHCPGCDEKHQVVVGTWGWNGSLDLPSFTPSVMVSGVQWPSDHEFYKLRHAVEAGQNIVCHSFVIDGKIKFLGDSTHELAGQTVDLPEWEGTL